MPAASHAPYVLRPGSPAYDLRIVSRITNPARPGSRRDDDPADRRPLLQTAHRFPDLLERIRPIDDGRDLALLQELRQESHGLCNGRERTHPLRKVRCDQREEHETDNVRDAPQDAALGVAETDMFPVNVPAGEYFLMGENIDNSYDSRHHGTVPRDSIFGRLELVFWSRDPGTGDIRWERFLKAVH